MNEEKAKREKTDGTRLIVGLLISFGIPVLLYAITGIKDPAAILLIALGALIGHITAGLGW